MLRSRPPRILRTKLLTRETAQILLRIGETDARSPSVFTVARALVRYLPPHDPRSEALACLTFVRHKVRYTKDPLCIELVYCPQELLQLIAFFDGFAEDCDSQATLLYALLRSIGHDVRFVVAGFTEGSSKIDHIFVQDCIGDIWHTIDPILPPEQVPIMLKKALWMDILTII